MIHELRVYRCVSGRLPALLKRFETITLELWERHGIRQAGFWTVAVGESNQDLYYLLAWDSLAEREQKWNAFASDPEWLAKRAETEKDGQIVANVSNHGIQVLGTGAGNATISGNSVDGATLGNGILIGGFVDVFGNVHYRSVLLNLPPAFVYACRVRPPSR